MFTPVVATEIEFYLHGADGRFLPEQIKQVIQEVCERDAIQVCSVQQERGRNQYEIALLPSRDIHVIAGETERFKKKLAEFFSSHGIQADFSAKPSPDEPGSGLHVHVHLENAHGENIFFRDGDAYSPELLYSIGGMLALMNPSMIIFAPYAESYLRFTAKSNAPTTVSWGTNNRTVAIRLPNKPLSNKHIEHRIAGSDADTAAVINAVLFAARYGIENKLDPGEPVYGDASSPQYGRPALAISLDEARKYHAECSIFKGL